MEDWSYIELQAFDTRWSSLVSCMHSLLYYQGKSLHCSLNSKLDGPHSWSEHEENMKISLPQSGIEPQFLSHPAWSVNCTWATRLIHTEYGFVCIWSSRPCGEFKVLNMKIIFLNKKASRTVYFLNRVGGCYGRFSEAW